ncbi:MAG: RNB domain-containing ribonuclease [Puniceicoccales bacterium]|jgi:ribonuclease R|nr:RNB domain-containing ribonuclease [Puniceicoccales bacterium]
MSIEDQILALMAQPDYTPITLDEIGKRLGGKSVARLVRKAMPRLMAAGTVAKVKKNCFCLPSDADLVSGVIHFRSSGAAKLIPDSTLETPHPAPVNIRAEDTGIALHGDKVLVRVYENYQRPASGRGARSARLGDDWRSGRVIRILERAFDALPGTLKKTRLFWYIIPDDPRIGRDIIVQDPAKTSVFPMPQEDDKVVVRIVEWKQRHLNPVGEIVEVLGKTHTPLAEYKAILYKYHLTPDFSAEVAREADAFPETVDSRDIKNRSDYRGIFTLTIDPDDAKDFDDALSIEHLPNGATRVGIHIADVSHYVRPNTALDREARARGNSTYLVGTVIPMLPHALSSGLCSLIEAQDRFAKAVIITYDKNHHPVEAQFANTIIRSRKRLTYKQALALLQWDDLDRIRTLPSPPPHQTGHPGIPLSKLSDAELREIQSAIRDFWQIASSLRRERLAKGALDLDTPEIKIYCDPEGYAENVVKNITDESHQLVEEFMLAANEAVARAFYRAKLPNLARVHDKPDPKKLHDLRQQLLSVGVKAGDLSKRAEVVKLLALLKHTPDAYPLQIAFLRSMRQACYRASADGHYGLAKQYYTHFTSPIRRYSDLVEHRILDFLLQRQNAPTAPARKLAPPNIAELEQTAAHLSRTERNSIDAERETVKIKLLELFEREIEKPRKTPFDAVIVEVRNHGLYVELTDSQAYGLIHISTLTDDLYHINADGTALVGRKFRRSYQLGSHIQVVADSVDRFKRQVDFRLAPETAAPVAGKSSSSAAPTGKTPRNIFREGRLLRDRRRSKRGKK